MHFNHSKNARPLVAGNVFIKRTWTLSRKMKMGVDVAQYIINPSVGTHNLIRVVVAAGEVIVEVVGLVDVEAGVDLDPEILPIRIVELSVAVVDLDRLTLPTPPQCILAVCITDGRLEWNKRKTN